MRGIISVQGDSWEAKKSIKMWCIIRQQVLVGFQEQLCACGANANAQRQQLLQIMSTLVLGAALKKPQPRRSPIQSSTPRNYSYCFISRPSAPYGLCLWLYSIYYCNWVLPAESSMVGALRSNRCQTCRNRKVKVLSQCRTWIWNKAIQPTFNKLTYTVWVVRWGLACLWTMRTR